MIRQASLKRKPRKGLTKSQILFSIADFEEDHIITREEIEKIYERFTDEWLFKDHKGRVFRVSKGRNE